MSLRKESVQKRLPTVAVSGPAAEPLHVGYALGSHGLLQYGVIGETLQAVCEGRSVADGNDVALFPVGEEVFAPCGCGADDRAAAGERLGLHEGKTFFDRGQHEDVAAGHEGGQFGLRKCAQELYLLLRERGEDRFQLGLD